MKTFLDHPHTTSFFSHSFAFICMCCRNHHRHHPHHFTWYSIYLTGEKIFDSQKKKLFVLSFKKWDFFIYFFQVVVFRRVLMSSSYGQMNKKKLKSTQIFLKLVSHLSSTPFFLTTDAYRRVALYYIVTLPLHRMYAYYYFYYMNILTDKHYILFYVQVAPKCNNFPPKISSMLKCILLPILIYFYLVTWTRVK